jgi:glycosyltransferase involved in cell wall biosynthesis
MGPAAITAMVLDALRASGAHVAHLDTRDERPIFHVDAFDLRNVRLGVQHTAQMLLASAHKVDLVFISLSQSRWGYFRDAVFMTIARLFRRRIVPYFHGAQFDVFYGRSNRLERWMIRRTLGWADAAVVLTPSLRGIFGPLVEPARVKVLENGLPDPFGDRIDEIIAERARRAVERPDAMRLLYLANDFGRKGACTAIRALAEPGLEGCELRMVGEPSPADEADARAAAAVAGVTDRVTLLGPLEGAAKFAEIESADAFVYPTEYDAQPLVVLEAMAGGLPVIASEHGGIPDTLGGAGALVPEDDPAAIADHLRRLLAEPSLRRQLGQAARDRYVANYTPALFDARLRALFAELLRG